MTEYQYPTAFSAWGKEEKAAADRVWERGRLTMGPEVEAFEEEFAAYHSRKHGIMVNSGSSANLIAVASLFEVEDEKKRLTRPRPIWQMSEMGTRSFRWPVPADAVVPAIAWSTTYAPFVQHGLGLVPLDVDDTWNTPVPKWIPRALTKVLVCASILGNPGYLAQWRERADALGMWLIEDNCESLGAEVDDGSGLCGTFGHLSTFSFFYSHQISAIEGGMILTDDDELWMLCRRLRAHGWTRDDYRTVVSFEDEYDFRHFGYNVRPLELHAAIAREQLKKLPWMREERRRNWQRFVDLTHPRSSDPPLPIRLPTPNGKTLSPFGLPFQVPSQEARNQLAVALRARGIDCRLPTGGSFVQHAYGAPWRNEKRPITPVADDIHRTGMFLGNAPWNITAQIEAAVEVMREVLL